jgi:calcineurin-like phosphoesterase
MIGDVVSDPGLEALDRLLPQLIKESSADFVMVKTPPQASGLQIPLWKNYLPPEQT